MRPCVYQSLSMQSRVDPSNLLPLLHFVCIHETVSVLGIIMCRALEQGAQRHQVDAQRTHKAAGTGFFMPVYRTSDICQPCKRLPCRDGHRRCRPVARSFSSRKFELQQQREVGDKDHSNSSDSTFDDQDNTPASIFAAGGHHLFSPASALEERCNTPSYAAQPPLEPWVNLATIECPSEAAAAAAALRDSCSTTSCYGTTAAASTNSDWPFEAAWAADNGSQAASNRGNSQTAQYAAVATSPFGLGLPDVLPYNSDNHNYSDTNNFARLATRVEQHAPHQAAAAAAAGSLPMTPSVINTSVPGASCIADLGAQPLQPLFGSEMLVHGECPVGNAPVQLHSSASLLVEELTDLEAVDRALTTELIQLLNARQQIAASARRSAYPAQKPAAPPAAVAAGAQAIAPGAAVTQQQQQVLPPRLALAAQAALRAAGCDDSSSVHLQPHQQHQVALLTGSYYSTPVTHMAAAPTAPGATGQPACTTVWVHATPSAHPIGAGQPAAAAANSSAVAAGC